MGQSSSQEIPKSPGDTAVPLRKHPPRVQVKPVPRPPSYAVPENKVLPSELPTKPLRAISSGLSKSNPELHNLFPHKENQVTENSNVSLDGDLQPSDSYTNEGKDTSLTRVKRRGKYQAPSPPITNGSPAHYNSQSEQFFNRAALAHRRTHSLERLPVIQTGGGQPRRPVSALNLTSSEHTIFEDPSEINSNNKSTPLPQKSTFPMDYSYAVTYAQLAGHRRRNLQTKLNSEKEVLLKQQSLPTLTSEPEMDSHIDTGVTNNGEIDLDNYGTPRRKKYRAPPPPSASQASNQLVTRERRPQVNGDIRTKYVPVSRSKSVAPPEEPPADYDMGVSPVRSTTVHLNGESDTPKRTEINIIPVIPVVSRNKTTADVIPKEEQTPKSSIVLRQRQPDNSVSPASPKSPPPVKPKPLRSPEKGNFVYPPTPVRQDSDVVTVNGQIIPEAPNLVIMRKETVSLRVDSESQSVAAAVLTQVPVNSVQDTNGNFTTPVKSDEPPHTGQIIISDIAPKSPKLNGVTHLSGNDKLLNNINIANKQDFALSNGEPSNDEPDSPAQIQKDFTETSTVKSESIDISGSIKSDDNELKESTVRDVKSVPVGFTTDILVDTSSVGGSSTPVLTQCSGDSGVTMPLSDQSFESLTTGDRSMELDAPPSREIEEDSETSTANHISQSTMTLPLDTDSKAMSLDRSMSISSSDSAKPASPPLTPDSRSQPRMSSLLQNDIISAAQLRGMKIKKPVVPPPKPKNPEEAFKEELAKIHQERESRFKQNTQTKSPTIIKSVAPLVNGVDAKAQDKGDNDSGIQACSFSEDWTPEHDLEDSDDEQQAAHTSRSGHFYEGRPKVELKASHSFRSYGESSSHARVLKKSDSDASDRYKVGSLRRFRQNVQQALHSVNKSSKKPSKVDKRSSLPPYLPSSPDSKQPVFRKLDPDTLYTRAPENGSSKLNQNGNHSKDSGSPHSSTADQHVQKKTGLAYVGGKVVLLPEFETTEKNTSDDGHRAPKRWKKTKKFAYMATTRKKEKQKMEQLLQDRIAEQERKMEEERQKQLEMEREFMKVRQVDKTELMKLDQQLSVGSNVPSRSTSIDESESVMEDQITSNGTSHGSINSSSEKPTALTAPALVQPQNIHLASGMGTHPQMHPMLFTGANQLYNPWFQSPQMHNFRYQTPLGMGVPGYGMLPNHYPASSLPGLTNYMQMLDINGQLVNVPVNPALINGYNWTTQSLDRSQSNGAMPYNTPNYVMRSNIPHHQTNSLQSNNNYNKHSQKQTIHGNPITIDDSVLNQMYNEYHNGPSQPQASTSAEEKKKRSNPLYYSSDEDGEYEVRDVHTGQLHSAGSVARISVPDHHRPLNHSHDEDMPSPSSVTSSSGDSGSAFPSQHYTSPGQHKQPNYAHFTQTAGSSDGVNLDESYSSADR